jgi:hypothetical protein
MPGALQNRTSPKHQPLARWKAVQDQAKARLDQAKAEMAAKGTTVRPVAALPKPKNPIRKIFSRLLRVPSSRPHSRGAEQRNELATVQSARLHAISPGPGRYTI